MNLYRWSLMLPVALALPACRPPAPVPPPPVRPIVAIQAPAPEAERERSFSGTARAAVQTLLSFRVGGEIMELPARQGLAVKAGDLVARLDPKTCELQVKQNEAQLTQADAQLEQARAEYERVRQLYEAQNVSKSALDGQQAAYKSAQAQRDAALKVLELARQQLEYCTLRAPIDGDIADVPVEIHQTVAAGQSIATLNSGAALEVQLGMPEALISQVRPGLATRVSFEAVPGGGFQAVVSEVGVRANETGAYPIKLRLLEQDTRIRPGMTAEATFRFPAAAGAAGGIAIPPVAVVPTSEGGRYVWVFLPDRGVVTRRDVTIGDLTSDGLQILAGLQPGEWVVTRGVHRLAEGMAARRLEE